MNKTLITLTLAALAACTEPTAPYESNLNAEQEALRVATLKVYKEKTIYYASPMEDVAVITIDYDDVELHCGKKFVSGCAYPSVIYVVDAPAFDFGFVLAHEFMHIGAHYTFGDSDAAHANSNLWSTVVGYVYNEAKKENNK